MTNNASTDKGRNYNDKHHFNLEPINFQEKSLFYASMLNQSGHRFKYFSKIINWF